MAQPLGFQSLVKDVQRLLVTEYFSIFEMRMYAITCKEMHHLVWRACARIPIFQDSLKEENFHEPPILCKYYGRCGKETNLSSFASLIKRYRTESKLLVMEQELISIGSMFEGAMEYWNESLLNPLPFFRNESAPPWELRRAVKFLNRDVCVSPHSLALMLAKCPSVQHIHQVMHLLDFTMIRIFLQACLGRPPAFFKELVMTSEYMQQWFDIHENANQLVDHACSHQEYFCHLPFLATLPGVRVNATLMLRVPMEMDGYSDANKALLFAFIESVGFHYDVQQLLEKFPSMSPATIDWIVTHLGMPTTANLNYAVLFSSWGTAKVKHLTFLRFFVERALQPHSDSYQKLCRECARRLFLDMPVELWPEFIALMENIPFPEYAFNMANLKMLRRLLANKQRLAFLKRLHERNIPVRVGVMLDGHYPINIRLNDFFDSQGFNIEKVFPAIEEACVLFKEELWVPMKK